MGKHLAISSALLLTVGMVSTGSLSTADATVSGSNDPCSVSVNYYCNTTTSSNYRASRTATSQRNNARDVSAKYTYKTVGSGTAHPQWQTGNGNLVYMTYGRIYDYLWCDSGGDYTGILIGCDYS